MHTVSLVTTSQRDVVLIPFVPAVAQQLFELIDRNRDHLSQLGDDTSARYPDCESVLRSITHPQPGRSRFGVWYSDEHPILIGTVNMQSHEVRWLLDPYDSFELGYWIGVQYCGRNFATVAVRAIVEHIRVRFGPAYITAQAHRENFASHRVLEKANFYANSLRTSRSDYILFTHMSARTL